MIEATCATVRELMPDHARGELAFPRVAEVEAHLSGCGDCRAEHAIVGALLSSRRPAPPRLAEGVVAAIRRERPSGSRPWWGISAAAVAALALGIGIGSKAGSSAYAPPAFGTETEEGVLWLTDDGLLAGAPILDDLSDEAIMELLDELAAGPPDDIPGTGA